MTKTPPGTNLDPGASPPDSLHRHSPGASTPRFRLRAKRYGETSPEPWRRRAVPVGASLRSRLSFYSHLIAIEVFSNTTLSCPRTLTRLHDEAARRTVISPRELSCPRANPCEGDAHGPFHHSPSDRGEQARRRNVLVAQLAPFSI